MSSPRGKSGYEASVKYFACTYHNIVARLWVMTIFYYLWVSCCCCIATDLLLGAFSNCCDVRDAVNNKPESQHVVICTHTIYTFLKDCQYWIISIVCVHWKVVSTWEKTRFNLSAIQASLGSSQGDHTTGLWLHQDSTLTSEHSGLLKKLLRWPHHWLMASPRFYPDEWAFRPP